MHQRSGRTAAAGARPSNRMDLGGIQRTFLQAALHLAAHAFEELHSLSVKLPASVFASPFGEWNDHGGADGALRDWAARRGFFSTKPSYGATWLYTVAWSCASNMKRRSFEEWVAANNNFSHYQAGRLIQHRTIDLTLKWKYDDDPGGEELEADLRARVKHLRKFPPGSKLPIYADVRKPENFDWLVQRQVMNWPPRAITEQQRKSGLRISETAVINAVKNAADLADVTLRPVATGRPRKG